MRRLRDLDLRPRWGLDGHRLIAAVAAWTPGQTLAVLDACERVRASALQGDSTSLAELLQASGPTVEARDGGAPTLPVCGS